MTTKSEESTAITVEKVAKADEEAEEPKTEESNDSEYDLVEDVGDKNEDPTMIRLISEENGLNNKPDKSNEEESVSQGEESQLEKEENLDEHKKDVKTQEDDTQKESASDLQTEAKSTEEEDEEEKKVTVKVDKEEKKVEKTESVENVPPIKKIQSKGLFDDDDEDDENNDLFSFSTLKSNNE